MKMQNLRVSAIVFAIVTLLGVAPALQAAHTLGDPRPFQVTPGHHILIPVTGGTFADVSTVQVRFTPTGGGSSTDQAPESVVANTSVGVRIPAGLAVGQYSVKVLLSGVQNDPIDPSVVERFSKPSGHRTIGSRSTRPPRNGRSAAGTRTEPSAH